MKKNGLRVALLSIIIFGLIVLPVFFAETTAALPIWIVSVIALMLINVFPSTVHRPSVRLRILSDGTDLLCAFLVNLFLLSVYGIMIAPLLFGWFTFSFWMNVLVSFLTELIVFWNGIIRVYCAANMIGMKWRVLGLICGMIPLANIFVLANLISLSQQEVAREEQRAIRQAQRDGQFICQTKYPILLVHGVFFRDLEKFNYWGRVPQELQKNGAALYYGNQQSALNIVDSAQELTAAIQNILHTTGCQKVNIIAHSKGGLDSRYAISCLGMAEYVASLTTINTPHRGCEFAEWLLDHASEQFRNGVADKYNFALKKMGDSTPDFLAAVSDLKASHCAEFNKNVPDMPQVYYQSVGSKINRPMRNIFPLCFSNLFAGFFDGPNDGLVTVQSAKWGSKFTYVESTAPEGLSHADMIDLMRHDKTDFDVREFYVELVSDLKNKGF
ncbi:MAG: triacylglycerol lipase [Clostridia bacterium]|nr:triacylglycerol lipase [Clostridia bacterium]